MTLSLWETRRSRERHCPSCDQRIAFVVPALAYYPYAALMFVFWTVAPFLLLYLAFTRHWLWGAMAAAAGICSMIFANLIFHPLLVARRVDEVPAAGID